ncbi:MAG: hypothetical protein LBE35_04680 [Clostridiales bacterium]|jgi:hypothetical protein|nr:hypothetical protein [Clostridiales bacterium]
MAKKPIRPGQLRRVGGLIMLSMAAGMVLTWFFTGLTFVLAIILLIAGFYFLFM